MLKLKSLDGDHALLNRFTVRSRTTIEDVEQAIETLQTIQVKIDEWEIFDLIEELKYRIDLAPKSIIEDVLNKIKNEFMA